MDPNVTLLRIRVLRTQIQMHLICNRPHKIEEPSAELCELVESLDGWLSRGGFLPKEWKR